MKNERISKISIPITIIGAMMSLFISALWPLMLALTVIFAAGGGWKAYSLAITFAIIGVVDLIFWMV